jgi:hypothetical protein
MSSTRCPSDLLAPRTGVIAALIHETLAAAGMAAPSGLGGTRLRQSNLDQQSANRPPILLSAGAAEGIVERTTLAQDEVSRVVRVTKNA